MFCSASSSGKTIQYLNYIFSQLIEPFSGVEQNNKSLLNLIKIMVIKEQLKKLYKKYWKVYY